MIELIEVEQVVKLDHSPAERCPDYDNDCVEVVSPSLCFCGNHQLPPADGYCPLMFGGSK